MSFSDPNRALQELCAGFEVLEETLVLRLEGGAEHYVPVFGRYASPAFGASLEDLAAKHGTEVLLFRNHLVVDLSAFMIFRLSDGSFTKKYLQTSASENVFCHSIE